MRIALCLVLTLAGSVSAIGGDAGPDAKFADNFKEKLPAGYTVKVEYYPNDNRIKSVTPLNPEGQPDGEAVYKVQYGWDVMRTIPYSKGAQDGVEKEYDYAQVDGKQVRYLSKETPWKAGKVNGTKKLYHPNGRVMTESTYVDGVTDGPSRNYDLTGRVEREATFKNGKRSGPMTEYWPLTGKRQGIVPYNMGKVDGLAQEFYDNGKPKKEIMVKNEEFHGIEKRYDEDGKLVKTVYWLHDKEVTKKQYEDESKK